MQLFDHHVVWSERENGTGRHYVVCTVICWQVSDDDEKRSVGGLYCPRNSFNFLTDNMTADDRQWSYTSKIFTSVM